MVFVTRLIRSARVKKKQNEYMEIKRMRLEDIEWKLGPCAKLRRFWSRKFPLILGGKRSKNVEEMTKCEKFQIKVITPGTYENFVFKSIVGFASGVILTYLFFVFFVFQLNFSLSTATYISSVLASVFSLGLAFSSRVRCLVLMSLPQLFSKRGRQALVAYAFILVFTGPAKNTMRNMRILSETMSCTQGKLKEAIKSLVQMIKEPFYAIKDAVQHLKERIKVIINKMKEMVNSIKKSLQAILGVIKNAYDWLNNIVGMCSKKLGTPFERCMDAFEGAIDDCKVQLGSMLNWMCSIAYVASHLCYAVKVFDYVCDLIDFVSDSIVGQVKRKIKEFIYQVRNIFYVHIEFSHSFKFSTEESKSLKEVASGMMTEISQRTSTIFSFFDIMSFGFSFFFLWMVFQILNYRRKFMTNDAFDNRYITDKIIQLDIRRLQLGHETILPLNVHERKKYAPISSIRLVQSEKKVITKSTIFLALSSLKLTLQMLADYCLYWILTMIRYHGQFKTHMDHPSSVQAQVDGKGMLTELYVSVLNAFQPSNVKLDLDTGACLPDPLPPDFNRYKQIATLMGIAWFICFTEPYGLRLRLVVMSYYNPERAQVRAVWLYNNILRSRGSFLKYARRQLRRKFSKGEDGIEEVSILDRLRARFPLLRKIWKGKDLKMCLLCGSAGSKQSPLVKCPRRDCVGLFCVNCYATLQNLCTICRLPIEYGDLSDISEERDSSEETMPKEHQYKMTESETTDELNLAELTDGTESILSFGYQYGERDPNEEIQIPLPQKDVEAQKSKVRATIYDFPEIASREGKEYSMTLAERTRSGMWSLITDSEPSELRRRSLRETKSELSIPSTIETSYIPPAVSTKIKEDIRRSSIRRGSSGGVYSDVIQGKKEHKGSLYRTSSSSQRDYEAQLSSYYLDEELEEREEYYYTDKDKERGENVEQYDYEETEFEEGIWEYEGSEDSRETEHIYDIEGIWEYERSEDSRETEHIYDIEMGYEGTDSDAFDYEEIHKIKHSMEIDEEGSSHKSKTPRSRILSEEEINIPIYEISEQSSRSGSEENSYTERYAPGLVGSTRVSDISPQRLSLLTKISNTNPTNQQLPSIKKTNYGGLGNNSILEFEDIQKIEPRISLPNVEGEDRISKKSFESISQQRSMEISSDLPGRLRNQSIISKTTMHQPSIKSTKTERTTKNVIEERGGFPKTSLIPRQSKSIMNPTQASRLSVQPKWSGVGHPGERLLGNYENVDDKKIEDKQKTHPRFSFHSNAKERLLLRQRSNFETSSGLSKHPRYRSSSAELTSQQPSVLKTERFTNDQMDAELSGTSILPRQNTKSFQQKFRGSERSNPTEYRNSQRFGSVRFSIPNDTNTADPHTSILKSSTKSSEILFPFQERKSSMKKNLVKDRTQYSSIRQDNRKQSSPAKLSTDGMRKLYSNELTADSSYAFRNDLKELKYIPEESNLLSIFKSQPDVGYIQDIGKKKVSFDTVEREGILRKKDVRSSEMIERWVKSGKFHQTYPDTVQPQTNFWNRIMKNIISPSNLFCGAIKNPGSNIPLVPLDKGRELKKLNKTNILRGKRKKEWDKQITGESNIWNKLTFWRNDSQSSSSLSLMIDDSQTPLIKNQSEEICLKTNEKTLFKKIAQQPTTSQIVYNMFKSIDG